jgi:hypothetical protein
MNPRSTDWAALKYPIVNRLLSHRYVDRSIVSFEMESLQSTYSSGSASYQGTPNENQSSLHDKSDLTCHVQTSLIYYEHVCFNTSLHR